MWRNFFEAYLGKLPEEREDHEVKVFSPLRPELNSSVGVNLTTGEFNDFGDAKLGGKPKDWYLLMHEIPEQEAIVIVSQYVMSRGTKPITSPPLHVAEIQGYQNELKSNSRILQYLNQRGIDSFLIKEYKIGWNGNRIIIPVFTTKGICVTVRMYSPWNQEKFLAYKYGKINSYGKGRLYPLQNYDKSKETYLCEGEWDSLILRKYGYNSLTHTVGAGHWNDWWNSFISKDVIICYDNDKAGQEGIHKVAPSLLKSGKSVSVITLPEDINDITDFFKKYAIEDFKKLVPEPYVPLEEFVKKEDLELLDVTLHESIFEHIKEKVRVPVRVVGIAQPYIIARKIKFNCFKDEKVECSGCACNNTEHLLNAEVTLSPTVLSHIRINEVAQISVLKRLHRVSTTCKYATLEILESSILEEIMISPELSFQMQLQKNKYILQPGFYAVEDQTIESNKSYSFEIQSTPNPWTQHVTCFMKKAVPLFQEFQNFEVTEELIEELSIFQPTSTVEAKFKEISKELELVTKIVGRRDLIIAVDLAYHSALSFVFQDTLQKKGWLELLVLGDTRTGKTATVEALIEHYQIGELSASENTSLAGLLGGLQQTPTKQWITIWGKIPANDGRLVAMDEVSGLSIEDIAQLSSIRSSGRAEITKIHAEQTNARTRLIWISNPRDGGSMNTAVHGCQHIIPLIGKLEDIARFDFCVTTAIEDVASKVINSPHLKTEVTQYTSEKCSKLVLWSWSRVADDIQFDDEAETLILKYAILQGEKYSSDIPLVEGANQRIKLAKIAVAVACRLFSTTTGKDVHVTKEHVEFAYSFLEFLYEKPSLDYAGYSNSGKRAEKSALNEYDIVFTEIKTKKCEFAFDANYITLQSLKDASGIEERAVKDLWRLLIKNHFLIERKSGNYVKSSMFIKLLKQLKEEEVNNEDTAKSTFKNIFA